VVGAHSLEAVVPVVPCHFAVGVLCVGYRQGTLTDSCLLSSLFIVLIMELMVVIVMLMV